MWHHKPFHRSVCGHVSRLDVRGGSVVQSSTLPVGGGMPGCALMHVPIEHLLQFRHSPDRWSTCTEKQAVPSNQIIFMMKCQLIELCKQHPVACNKTNLQHYFCCDFPQVRLWLSTDSAHGHCSRRRHQQALRREPACASRPSSGEMVGGQTYPERPHRRLWYHWISRRRIYQQSHGILNIIGGTL